MAKRKIPVVQVAGLCKTFKDFWRRPKVDAVKDLSFDIQPGEVVGLLGPNGSGKSTTIKMLLGLLYPTRGRIAIFGRSPTDVSVKSRIGFLPEESYLYRFLVASETLDYYARLFRIPEAIRKERIERLLEMVGLQQEAKRPVGEYSKGMARRIGLAQALINDPEFLILDEPTSGLDPIGVRQIKDVIEQLSRIGKTILLSSHVLADVEDVCDRIIILYGGQQRAEGSVERLLEQDDRTQIITESLPADALDQIRTLATHDRDGALFEVSHPRDRLEDLFLKIVHEAQAANVKTYGAREGGAVPTFLATATQAEMHDVVGELIAAGSAAPAPGAAETAALEPAEDPSKGVLDELLGRRPEEDEESDASPGRPSAPAAPPAARKPGGAPRVEADQGIIDSLLTGEGRAGDDEDKS